MVVDEWKNLEGYSVLHPRFPKAFAFLKELLEKNAEDGRHVMPGTNVPEAVYVNLGTNEIQPAETAKAEAHRKYIDVQVVLAGEENMYVPADVPEVATPYQADRDCAFYAPVPLNSCHQLRVKEGNFVIFFAGELHAPSVAIGEKPAVVRKAVMKVLA